MKTNDEPAEKGVRPRPHYFALIWVWVSVVATTLLYLLFLSLESWRPQESSKAPGAFSVTEAGFARLFQCLVLSFGIGDRNRCHV